MLSYEVFEPARPAEANLGIIYNNHLGASIAGDVGEDAQYLANDTGLRVLAYDRQGTGDGVSIDLSLTNRLKDNYLRSVTNYGRVLSALAKSEGFEKVLMVGKSAGGCETLAMASSGSIENLAGVATMDPLGLVDISQHQGFLTWLRYQRGPERDKLQSSSIENDDEEKSEERKDVLKRIDQAKQAVAMGRRQIVDIAHYRGVWSTTVGIESALVLARARTDVPVVMTFAGNTFVAGPEFISKAVAELPKERYQSDPHGAPFVTGILPNTLHSEFDKRPVVSRHAKALVSLTLSYRR